VLNVAVHILVTELLILFFFCPASLICFYPSFSLPSSLYLSFPASFLTSVHFPVQLTTYKTLPFHFVVFFCCFNFHLKLPSLLTPFVWVCLIHYSSSCIFFISSSYPEDFFVSVFKKIHGFILPPSSLLLDELVFLKRLFPFSQRKCVTLRRFNERYFIFRLSHAPPSYLFNSAANEQNLYVYKNWALQHAFYLSPIR
jgi:hypothetical protein